MKKKVLITGASGFLGRNIFEYLSRREDLDVYGTYYTKGFYGMSSSKLSFVDLCEPEDALNVIKGFDVVIHTAAITAGIGDAETNKHHYMIDNSQMNLNMFSAVYENLIPQMIFLSCTVAYPMDIGLYMKEEDLDLSKVHPKYKLAWIKIFGEKLCDFYVDFGRTKFTAIRHSNIYGPHDKFDLEKGHVFAATVKKVMDAPDGSFITVWGNGKEQRDLLYVSDFVKFVERVIDKQDYEYDVFNVGFGYTIEVCDLAEKIIRESGKKLEVRFDSSKSSAPSVKIDIYKAKKKFGWFPQISLDDGIRKTMEWYKKESER